LVASAELAGYLDWPGVAQAFRIDRQITMGRTGLTRTEVLYGLTSLTPQAADPARLLRYVREHWHIENRSHWVRDVTFDEDRSQVRTGSMLQVMAALRNAVIGLLRANGATTIAARTRRLAAQPWEALALLGITPKN
jgi:hypothetical protein